MRRDSREIRGAMIEASWRVRAFKLKKKPKTLVAAMTGIFQEAS